MDQKQIQFLEGRGIDYQEGLGRFMNNAPLFEKFLLKFLEDTSFAGLKAALEAENCEAAFHAAHTLKGVAGNLSLKALAQVVSQQTELLRGGDLAGGRGMMDAVTQAYDAAIEAIQAIH